MSFLSNKYQEIIVILKLLNYQINLMGDSEHRMLFQILNEQNEKYIQPQLILAPFQNYSCECQYCKKQNSYPNHFYHTLSTNFQQDQDQNNISLRDRDYSFLIKRLIPPKHISRALRISIPEICLFTQQGEPEFVIYSSKISESSPNYQIKMITGLKINPIKKLFNERRKKQFCNKPKSSDDKIKTSLNNFQRRNSDQYVSVQMNEIENNTKIQILSKKTKEEIQKVNLDKSVQEAVILKFEDGNVQILSETDFANLIYKKRMPNDLIYFQNYIKTKKNSNPIIKMEFILKEDSQHEFFHYAQNEINQMNNEIIKASSDYIPVEREEDFENKLIAQNKHLFLKLQSFKIYHFMEVAILQENLFFEQKFCQIRITKCEYEWLQDDIDQFHFISASKLQYVQIEVTETKNVEQKPLKSELKVEKLELNQGKFQQNIELQEICKQCLFKFYDQKKQELGINIQKYETPKDIQSEKVFNEINTQNISFSQLISSQSYSLNKQRINQKLARSHVISLQKNRIYQQSQTMQLSTNQQYLKLIFEKEYPNHESKRLKSQQESFFPYQHL